MGVLDSSSIREAAGRVLGVAGFNRGPYIVEIASIMSASVMPAVRSGS